MMKIKRVMKLVKIVSNLRAQAWWFLGPDTAQDKHHLLHVLGPQCQMSCYWALAHLVLDSMVPAGMAPGTFVC
jgi:hypothetical protein